LPISKHLIGDCYVLFLFVDIEVGYRSLSFRGFEDISRLQILLRSHRPRRVLFKEHRWQIGKRRFFPWHSLATVGVESPDGSEPKMNSKWSAPSAKDIAFKKLLSLI
jgi:hypothetical protein